MGSMMGALAGGLLGAKFGPRNVFLASTLPGLVCWSAITLVPGIQLMSTVRMLHGFVNSIGSVVAMRFQASTSSPRYRGMLSLTPEALVIVGIVTAFISGRFLAWRLCMLGLGVVLNALLAGILLALPSDPCWLLARGRLEEARRALLFYRGPDADTSAVKQAAAEEAEAPPRPSPLQLLATLRERRYLLPVLYVVLVLSVQAWSGVAVLQNYAVLFFRRVGVSMEPFLLTVVMMASRLPVVLLSGLLMDRCGRRPLLIVSALGMVLCYLGMVAFFLIPAVGGVAAVPIVCLVGAICFFQLGVSPVGWVLLGEMLPSHLAELCSGWVMFLYFLVTVGQLQVLPALLAALGEPGLFAMWAALLVGLALFTLLLLPETAGLTGGEIEALFHLQEPLHRVARLAARVAGLPVLRGIKEPVKQPPVVVL